MGDDRLYDAHIHVSQFCVIQEIITDIGILYVPLPIIKRAHCKEPLIGNKGPYHATMHCENSADGDGRDEGQLFGYPPHLEDRLQNVAVCLLSPLKLELFLSPLCQRLQQRYSFDDATGQGGQRSV
jgi:hypothetical protein